MLYDGCVNTKPGDELDCAGRNPIAIYRNISILVSLAQWHLIT